MLETIFSLILDATFMLSPQINTEQTLQLTKGEISLFDRQTAVKEAKKCFLFHFYINAGPGFSITCGNT